jgi:hypothetical protein
MRPIAGSGAIPKLVGQVRPPGMGDQWPSLMGSNRGRSIDKADKYRALSKQNDLVLWKKNPAYPVNPV